MKKFRLFYEFRPIVQCNGYQYCLLKDGYPPYRQHVLNKNGGRWIIDINHSEMRQTFIFYQLKILLSLILGRFDDYQKSVCGYKAEMNNHRCRVSK